MENIKRIVRQDKSKVITPQKRLEHRTGTDTFVQVFLNKELEKETHNKPREENQRSYNKRHDQNNGVQIFLKKWVTWCFASGTKK